MTELVRSYLDTLTVREKILQTVVLQVKKIDDFVSEQVGAMFFFGEIITKASGMSVETARETIQQYHDNARIPMLFTSDFEHGCGGMMKKLTALPYMMSLGATASEELAYAYGKATALEACSVGANWTFAPVSDLNVNFRNPLVNVRSMTDDADLACRLLPHIIRGMQDGGMAACAKHFPGDGCDWRDQHIVTTCNTLSMEEWKQQHGRVFQTAIDAGVYSIMPGHITLPAYQKEVHENGMNLPATLSHELITDLLKGEMGFDGVVVTDALNMGGFNGWYETHERAQIESFRAGCDMMLWPTDSYVSDMEKAIEAGYVSMERLDDAVCRILTMKEKLGLFDRPLFRELSEEDRAFVKNTQQQVAEASITLIRDKMNLFPMTPKTRKHIAVIPITHYLPALEEAKLLCDEWRSRGFEVDYLETGINNEQDYDLIVYALFSRPFRPIGFLDFHSAEAYKIVRSLSACVDKTLVVSFGSPYFGQQYFERALTYVNAYSMLSPSVKAFARASCGEIPFTDYSPVKL